MRLARLVGGIVLLVLGLVAFGIGYQIHNNAQTSYSNLQCNNLVGAIVGAVYNPEAQACQQAQNYQTISLLGIATGIIMIIIGVVLLFIDWIKTATTTTIYSIAAQSYCNNTISKRRYDMAKENICFSKICIFCKRDVEWWQSGYKQQIASGGYTLVHEECYKHDLKSQEQVKR